MLKQDEVALWPVEDKGYALRLIRRRARRLVCAAGLPPTEREEIEQQLTVDLWKGARSFDPARGSWRGFATVVVSHACGKLWHHWRAQKRYQPTTSLSAITAWPAEGTQELSQTVSESEGRNHRGLGLLPPNVQQDLAMDLADVAASLPVDQRNMLVLLSRHSKRDAASTVGVSQRIVDSHLRKLGARLRRTGIAEYFAN